MLSSAHGVCDARLEIDEKLAQLAKDTGPVDGKISVSVGSELLWDYLEADIYSHIIIR